MTICNLFLVSVALDSACQRRGRKEKEERRKRKRVLLLHEKKNSNPCLPSPLLFILLSFLIIPTLRFARY
jgi:hypothetical protein